MSKEKENENSSIDAEVETPEAEEATESTTKEEPSELEELKAKVAEWEDKFLRTHASFENSKKLLAKDKAAAVAYANESFASDLLSVIDSFESALATIKGAKSDQENEVLEKIKEGVELTFNQLKKVLEKNHIKEIPSDGEFDPEVHQAIMQVESDEHENGQIVQVLQKGYKLKDRVLRPAMVSTAK